MAHGSPGLGRVRHSSAAQAVGLAEKGKASPRSAQGTVVLSFMYVSAPLPQYQ
jgi:hypothetical protein